MKAMSRNSAISPIEWNRQMHWARAVKESHKKGQFWIHQVPVYCREGYEAMLDEHGNCMVSRRSLMRFIDNEANQKWYNLLLSEAKMFMEQGDTEEAAEKLEMAKLIRPEQVDAHLIEIDLMVSLQENEAAKARFEALYPLFLNNADFMAELGRFHARLGDYLQAVQCLNVANQLNPKNDEIASRLKLARYFAKRVA